MNTVLEKIKNLIPQLSDDGSKELAAQYRDMIEHEGFMRELRMNEGFKRILGTLRRDFKEKMLAAIASDPELREMRKMFIRVLGAEGATEQVEQMIDELIDNPKS